jgi:hypothetical protein
MALPWATLRPYVSLIVLERTENSDDLLAFQWLVKFLGQPGRQMPDRVTSVVADSPADESVPTEVLAALGFDQVAGFVRQHQSPPAWATPNVEFVDLKHDLTLALRRGRLIAVRAENDVTRRLQTWLNEPARPYRRIAPEVLEGAFLQGEAKMLWLQDTRRPNVNRAGTKNLGGPYLQNALDPMDDANYSMGAGRADLADDGSRVILNGLIGTTPPDSTVWFKQSADLYSFGLAVAEIFNLIEEEQAAGPRQAIPFVARPVSDLSGVEGAYDISITGADQLPPNQSDEETMKAADLLQEVTFGVHGGAGADLSLDVGFGSICGTLRVTLQMSGSHCVVAPGLDPLTTPTDPVTVQKILTALQSHPELLSVYYRSGHALSNNQLFSEQLPQGGFSGWSFEDFSGYVLTQEKPNKKKWQEIHNLIGKPGDTSLFGWVVKQYNDGWLTCDDGPEEVADFVHIASDLTLSLIHVKGANSSSPGRGVATTAYEVVAGQATKNSLYLMNPGRLRQELENPAVDEPATWTNGKRVDDRNDFLAMLDKRDAASRAEIVIVQPHLSETKYTKLNTIRSSPKPSDDVLRLLRLEDLLQATKRTAVSRKGDLTVLTARH